MISRLRRLVEAEEGVAIVSFVVLMPLLLLLCVLAIDVGNFFVHKRSLQTKADAAALAGARSFRFPACEDAEIRTAAMQYSGKGDGVTTYNNDTYPKISADRLHAQINEPSYFNQGKPGDPDLVEGDGDGPCATQMVDVKMTETDLPYFFGTGIVPNINAQARVQLLEVNETDGLVPIGIQEATPKKVRAFVVDEGTTPPTTLASIGLTEQGSSGGLLRFDNEANPVTLQVPSTVRRLGVRVALGGGDSTTCGQALVECYDTDAEGKGLSFIRASSSEPPVTSGQPPRARAVVLSPGTCTNASYNSSSSPCAMDVSAKVSFQPAVQQKDLTADPGPKRAFLTARYAGDSYPMTYSPADQTWRATGLTVPSGTIGPRPLEIEWEQQVGKVGGDTCKVGGANKCEGTITEGGSTTLQRTFWNAPADQTARGGPIAKLDVLDAATLQQVSDLERCSAAMPTCEYKLIFDVGVAGGLELSKVEDPAVSLRVNGNQTQSLQCDPDLGGSNGLEEMLSEGCIPRYRVNDGTSECLAKNTEWAKPQPWACVALRTGDPPNTTPRGLNRRILCSPALGDAANCSSNGSAAICTNPNKWPNYELDDPRIVQVFLTPFGSFTGSGLETVPVTGFAAFYITGYTASGGVKTPCADIPAGAPGADEYSINPPPAGNISGHFIKKAEPNVGGGGTEACDIDSIDLCVGALVK